MAKNKNRKHEPKQQRSARSAEHREQPSRSTMESQPSSIGQSQGGSGDSGRRHQKRFGHN